MAAIQVARMNPLEGRFLYRAQKQHSQSYGRELCYKGTKLAHHNVPVLKEYRCVTDIFWQGDGATENGSRLVIDAAQLGPCEVPVGKYVKAMRSSLSFWELSWKDEEEGVCWLSGGGCRPVDLCICGPAKTGTIIEGNRKPVWQAEDALLTVCWGKCEMNFPIQCRRLNRRGGSCSGIASRWPRGDQ